MEFRKKRRHRSSPTSRALACRTPTHSTPRRGCRRTFPLADRERNGRDSAFGIRYQGGSDPRGGGERRLLEPRHLQVFAVSFGEPGAEPVTASISSLCIICVRAETLWGPQRS